jgi:hypothetical protein
LEVPKAFAGRLLLLLPVAFCVFLLLASEDRMVRLLAIIALVVLTQVREWLLVQSIKGVAKK